MAGLVVARGKKKKFQVLELTEGSQYGRCNLVKTAGRLLKAGQPKREGSIKKLT